MHVEVKSLSPVLQAALRSVEYHRTDIAVVPAEKVSPAVAGGRGQRGFLLMIRLDTGETKLMNGSWGGANIFNPGNAVDLDTNAYPLPSNGVIIQGTRGHGGTLATMYVPISEASQFMPAPAEELTQVERDCLYCVRSLKGGAYRREEMRRRRVTESTVDAMVSRGLLARNRAGAISITTAGRNAVDGYYGH